MSKVILLAPTPPPVGGIAAWTVRMMQAQLPHEWKVEVVDEKIIGKREFFGNKTKHNIMDEIKRCFGIWRGLKKAINDPNALVVHACIAANTMPVIREYISACIAKKYHRKFIIHFRCTVPNMVKSRTNRFFVKKLCDKSDCVMLLNSQSYEFLRCITNTNIVVIPNFVDENEIVYRNVIRPKIEKIVYVGGIIKSKGCLDLIEVAKRFPNVTFRLIGNPDAECEMAAKSVKNVSLAGVLPHDAIKKELIDADVFMFLTYFSGEGFSNSLAEAMATGLPCIVTDWAANKDMIEGKGGVVVPIHDPKSVQNALLDIMNPEIRKEQSAFNIKKITNEYSEEVILSRYVDCYEKVVLDEHS